MTTAQIGRMFAGDMAPDVYHLVTPIALADLAQLSRENRTNLYYIDGDRISDRMSLFQQFATVMGFSEYFGHNWDALWDSLTDFDADVAERQVIMLDRLDNFEHDNPQQWSILLELCHQIVGYYHDTATPMYIAIGSKSPQLTAAGLMPI